MIRFSSLEEAYRTARGDTNCTLEEYYLAWQHLSDFNAPLCESDAAYLDKLICDGSVLTSENYEELGGVPYYPVHVGGSSTTMDQ